MTNEQNNRLIQWVGEMLTGPYSHCKRALLVPNTLLRSAFGVALEVYGHEKEYGGEFINMYPVIRADQTVSSKWLSRRFGLVRPASFYATMNDLKDDYFTVSASLLGECLDDDRKTFLQTKLVDGFNYRRMT